MIDTMYLHVAKILTFANGTPLTNATGFFYLHQKFLYLVTAGHVVLNEAAQHRPDHLQVSLHSDPSDLRQCADLSIPLYKDGVPQWYQHPRFDADVAAVAINDPTVLNSYFLAPFGPDDIMNNNQEMPLGQDVLILGFPLGFHDTLNNLPIVRSATIASSFAHPFKGEPYFLTDARLHRGMSGSPVIFFPESDDQGTRRWKLLGIHTSALDVSNRDPTQDERLALNTTWYASLIPEMLPSHEAPNANP